VPLGRERYDPIVWRPWWAVDEEGGSERLGGLRYEGESGSEVG